MATQSVIITWRGLTISATVYSEPDPLRSDGSKLYDIDKVTFVYESDDVTELIYDAYEREIREAILEAVK